MSRVMRRRSVGSLRCWKACSQRWTKKVSRSSVDTLEKKRYCGAYERARRFSQRTRTVANQATGRHSFWIHNAMGRASHARRSAEHADWKSSALSALRRRSVDHVALMIVKRGNGYGVSVYDRGIGRKRWIGTFATK